MKFKIPHTEAPTFPGWEKPVRKAPMALPEPPEDHLFLQGDKVQLLDDDTVVCREVKYGPYTTLEGPGRYLVAVPDEDEEEVHGEVLGSELAPFDPSYEEGGIYVEVATNKVYSVVHVDENGDAAGQTPVGKGFHYRTLTKRALADELFLEAG